MLPVSEAVKSDPVAVHVAEIGADTALSLPSALPRNVTPKLVEQPARSFVSSSDTNSEEIDQLITALALAQMEFTVVERTLTAKIKSRKEGGASYEYAYAPLDEVLGAVRPALSKNGIAIVQLPTARQGSVTITTVLAHGSGQWIKNNLTCLCDGDPQAIGSAISYLRRYALQAMTGVAPNYGDDDDGALAQRGHESPSVRRGSGVEPDGETRELLTAVREIKRDGKASIFGIKSTTGECFTDAPGLVNVAREAMANEKPVVLRTELRQQAGKDKPPVKWLVEIVVR